MSTHPSVASFPRFSALGLTTALRYVERRRRRLRWRRRCLRCRRRIVQQTRPGAPEEPSDEGTTTEQAAGPAPDTTEATDKDPDSGSLPGAPGSLPTRSKGLPTCRQRTSLWLPRPGRQHGRPRRTQQDQRRLQPAERSNRRPSQAPIDRTSLRVIRQRGSAQVDRGAPKPTKKRPANGSTASPQTEHGFRRQRGPHQQRNSPPSWLQLRRETPSRQEPSCPSPRPSSSPPLPRSRLTVPRPRVRRRRRQRRTWSQQTPVAATVASRYDQFHAH